MKIWQGIRRISTIRSIPVQAPPLPPEEHISGARVFDPDDWPLMTWKLAPEETPPEATSSEDVADSEDSADSSGAANKKRSEIIEENRTDGHAPIKTAASVLMQGLQKSSRMTTSLSDIDVTLFNFHSTKFAERLLNRNVSSCVIVESSHVFSKTAKKFAEKLTSVDAYRADIYTLMGVGRKKTTRFPRKLLFAGFNSKTIDESLHLNIRPLSLKPSSATSSEDQNSKFRRPHLLAVLPTDNIQRTIVDSMIQHALLHHSGLDTDTVFRYGDTNLLTFLSCGTLSQYTCSTSENLHFLSHQHRRHSALFDKLFELRLLHTREPGGIPIGHAATSFHPQLPSPKKVTHEKKLAEVNLRKGMQYAVQISPRNHVRIADEEVTTEKGNGKILVNFSHFLTQIGRQPNAKATSDVIRSLFPESSISTSPDLLPEDKIGSLPLNHLESIFIHVSEELAASATAQGYCNELRIKRAS